MNVEEYAELTVAHICRETAAEAARFYLACGYPRWRAEKARLELLGLYGGMPPGRISWIPKAFP